MNDIFTPKHFTAVRRPLTQASTLPGWCYADDAWYAREIELLHYAF